MRTQTLTELITGAKSRADLTRSGFVSTAQWVDFINTGITELWDELTKAYGEEYFLRAYPFTSTTASEYDLPADFGQLRGVDIYLGGQWVGVTRFGLPRRNSRGGFSGGSPVAPGGIEYALWGSKLKFIPDPASGQSMRVLYTPRPDRLATLTCAAADVSAAADTLTIASHGLRDDQLVRLTPATTASAALPAPLRSDTDYYVIVVDLDTIQLAESPAGMGTATAVDLTDTGTGTHTVDGVLDGVAGWEEWPILKAAILAKIKGEDDSMPLERLLYGTGDVDDDKSVRGRIKAASKQRDSGEPPRVINVYGRNSAYADDLEEVG